MVVTNSIIYIGLTLVRGMSNNKLCFRCKQVKEFVSYSQSFGNDVCIQCRDKLCFQYYYDEQKRLLSNLKPKK